MMPTIGSAMRETQENGVKVGGVGGVVEVVGVVLVGVVEVVGVVLVGGMEVVGVVLVGGMEVVGVVLVGDASTPPSRKDHPKVSIIYVLAGSPTALLYLEYPASNSIP